MSPDRLKTALLNLIRAHFPELRDGTHLPMKARVLALHGEAGTVQLTSGSRRYSVDVQPLHPDGDVDTSRDPIRDVPLDMPWPGPDARGIYHLPAVGSIVRVEFYGGQAAWPFVAGMAPDGWATPAVADGELLVQHRTGTHVRISPTGDVQVLLTETAAGGSDLSVTQTAPIPGHAAANHTHAQTCAVSGANRTEAQTAASGGANRTITLTDGGAGGNLTINLSAPGGGTMTVNATGDITLTSDGLIKLAGGGAAVARVGDSVDLQTGLITTGSAKVQSG